MQIRKKKISNLDLRVMVRETVQDLKWEWETFKKESSILHDIEVKDDPLSAIILYLIKRGKL